MSHRELVSDDGRWLLVQQQDRNVVVYRRRPDGSLYDPVWHSFLQDMIDGRAPDAPPDAPDPPPSDPPPPQGGAGLIEPITAQTIRPRLTREQIASFVPSQAGPFIFPPPYGTRGIRLTSSADGLVHPIGMSYWPVINNHQGQPELRVVLSVNQTLTIFRVDKAAGRVVDTDLTSFGGTGEGVYWSLTDPMLVYVPDASGLLSYHVVTREIRRVVAVLGHATQWHSSADGLAHSMTLDGQPACWYANDLHRWESSGYDESHLDKSGRWLLIKEHGDNRIVDLHSGKEWTITNAGGAVGHSDMGWGYMVGEDDQTNPGGVFRLWHFTENGPVDGGVMYSTDWTSMTRYVSHCNARQGVGIRQHVLFSSSHDGDVVRANELVVVELGSDLCRVVCPNLTDLNANDPHGGDNRYWRKTRAAICPTGTYAVWTGNCGTERVDAFVVEL